MNPLKLRKNSIALVVALSLLSPQILGMEDNSANASSLILNNSTITSVPDGASGAGTPGDPLVYPSSISYGAQVAISFSAEVSGTPQTLTSCTIIGGQTAVTRYLSATTTSATVCHVTGRIDSDQAAGLAQMRLTWGVGGNQNEIVSLLFQAAYNHTDNQSKLTSMILQGTNGLQIGSTISIATPTIWKNTFLNTQPSSAFHGFAFVSANKCGEAGGGSTRVYQNNNDWDFTGNGFQIPASTTDANSRTIADLTGYGVTFMIYPNNNNMMMDSVGPFKIGESTLVPCTFTYQNNPNNPNNPNLGASASSSPSYTGPSISSFNLGSVAPGGSLVATGKKLDQIQSATIGGKAASLTYFDNGLAITVPTDLAPGTYNLVMQTSYGSLTQLNAVVVKTPKPVSSFTLKGTGSAISSDLASEIKAIGSMYSADYSKIHCVVNTTDEAAAAIATQACSLLKTGSLSAATTLTTLKATFKGSGFWLRVYLAG